MTKTRRISTGILFVFLLNSIGPQQACAQDLTLPTPGARVQLSPAYNFPVLKGIKIHPDNPFKFEFVLDVGAGPRACPTCPGQPQGVAPTDLKSESQRLIKYFLASLTVPEKDLWVNLSPYEKNRIVPDAFGKTEMGRDLLAQDYMLKQITASLIYPEDEIGKKFWKRVYEEAAKKFGSTNIPVDTFNKVWIMPDKAVVYENIKAGTAYVVERKLKVMLEEDYLAMEKNTRAGDAKAEPLSDRSASEDGRGAAAAGPAHVASQMIREIIIPVLTREINEGKNFAQLRQVYNSLILAQWYKKKIKDSILNQVYANKNKIKGIEYAAPSNDVELIYQQYLQAFKKGAYNLIKEEQDPISRQMIPRKYFAGGIQVTNLSSMAMATTQNIDFAMLDAKNSDYYTIIMRLDAAMNANQANAAMIGSGLLRRFVVHESNPHQINTSLMKGGAMLLTRADSYSVFRSVHAYGTSVFGNDSNGSLVRKEVGGGWKVENTSFEYIDKMLGILRRIERQDQVRLDKTRAIIYIDLGCGNGRALVELQKVLQERARQGRGIANVQLYGYANEMYPDWRKAPKGIHFILDTIDHLKDYFEPASVSLMASYFGIEHVFNDPQGEEFIRTAFKDLRNLLKKSGEIVLSSVDAHERELLKDILPLTLMPGQYYRSFNQIYPVEFRHDPAMNSKDDRLGGIDLSSDKALTVQKDSKSNGPWIQFHLDPAQMSQWQAAPGVIFDIIDIKPMTAVRLFLDLRE